MVRVGMSSLLINSFWFVKNHTKLLGKILINFFEQIVTKFQLNGFNFLSDVFVRCLC